MVAFARKRLKEKTIGHAGTLDPLATGLLIVGVGRESTKRLDEFKNLPKTYIAAIHLGAISDTYDKMGVIKINENAKQISEEKIHEIINSFKGKQLQIPPMFSAKKVGGKKLYDLARRGIEIERKPCEIEIYDISILDYTWPILKIEVKCSTGTYIRSLANDIGAKLGVDAYCEELTRTAIGEYTLEQAKNINEI